MAIQSKAMMRSQKSRYKGAALETPHEMADYTPNKLSRHGSSPMLLNNVGNTKGHRALVMF